VDVGSPRLGVADFGGVAGKVGKVNDAERLRWGASGGGGGAGLQLKLGNASVMVKPMLASEASIVAIGDVGDAADVSDEGDGTSVGDELDSAIVWDEVVRLPAMRLPMRH
jgi:hypothetical protein